MDAYEIRIVTPARKILRSTTASYGGDYVAISRARALIAEGQITEPMGVEKMGVEVWRGGHCIYADGAA